VDLRLLSAEYSLLSKNRDINQGNGALKIGRGPDICTAASNSEIVDIEELCRIGVNVSLACSVSFS
jgi:hypothetical protein